MFLHGKVTNFCLCISGYADCRGPACVSDGGTWRAVCAGLCFPALSVAVRMYLDAFNSVLFSCFDFLTCFMAFCDGIGFCDVFWHRIDFFPTLRVDFITVFLRFFAFAPSILSPIVTCFLPFFCSFRFSLDFLFCCFGFCSGFDSSTCPSVNGCCCRLVLTAGCTSRFSSSHGQSKSSIFLFSWFSIAKTEVRLQLWVSSTWIFTTWWLIIHVISGFSASGLTTSGSLTSCRNACINFASNLHRRIGCPSLRHASRNSRHSPCSHSVACRPQKCE